MDGWQASTFGSRMAEVFDTWYGVPREVDAEVAFLANLARQGPALELGIGTGRIALPLAGRGVRVQGIEISEDMVERLRAKSGGQDIPVVMGDFADVAVEGSFPLVYAVFSSLYLLLTQDDQQRCFANVARHLTADGVFVVQALVPNLARLSQIQSTQVGRVEVDRVYLEASRHDPLRQHVETQQVVISEQGVRLYPVSYRYIWPSELDLMGLLAGLRLRARWGGWQCEPFTPGSPIHVSVYEPATSPSPASPQRGGA